MTDEELNQTTDSLVRSIEGSKAAKAKKEQLQFEQKLRGEQANVLRESHLGGTAEGKMMAYDIELGQAKGVDVAKAFNLPIMELAAKFGLNADDPKSAKAFNSVLKTFKTMEDLKNMSKARASIYTSNMTNKYGSNAKLTQYGFDASHGVDIATSVLSDAEKNNPVLKDIGLSSLANKLASAEERASDPSGFASKVIRLIDLKSDIDESAKTQAKNDFLTSIDQIAYQTVAANSLLSTQDGGVNPIAFNAVKQAYVTSGNLALSVRSINNINGGIEEKKPIFKIPIPVEALQNQLSNPFKKPKNIGAFPKDPVTDEDLKL